VVVLFLYPQFEKTIYFIQQMPVFKFIVVDGDAEGGLVHDIFEIFGHVGCIFHEFELGAYELSAFGETAFDFVVLFIDEVNNLFEGFRFDNG
jgi:hypothetical protein